MRVTAARINVLATLMAARHAFSHQDMQEAFTEMDRVTLYRALDCLINAGLAHKIAGDDRIFRYSAGVERPEWGIVTTATPQRYDPLLQHQHIHFKCTRCAKVFCLDDVGQAGPFAEVVAAMGSNRLPMTTRQLQIILQKNFGIGFLSHNIEMTIKGWCAGCAQ